MADDPKPTGIAADVRDTVDLLKAYAQQETVGPLKGLARYVAFGVAGSLLLALGVIMLAMSGLRALQGVSAFDDTWNFVPYVLVIVGLLLVIGLSVMAISRGDR